MAMASIELEGQLEEQPTEEKPTIDNSQESGCAIKSNYAHLKTVDIDKAPNMPSHLQMINKLNTHKISWHPHQIQVYTRDYLYPWSPLIQNLDKGEVRTHHEDGVLENEAETTRKLLAKNGEKSKTGEESRAKSVMLSFISIPPIFRKSSMSGEQQHNIKDKDKDAIVDNNNDRDENNKSFLGQYNSLFHKLYDNRIGNGMPDSSEIISIFLELSGRIETTDNNNFAAAQARRDELCECLPGLNWQKALIEVYCAIVGSSVAIEGYDSFSFEQVYNLLKNASYDNSDIGSFPSSLHIPWSSRSPNKFWRQPGPDLNNQSAEYAAKLATDRKATTNLANAYAHMIECAAGCVEGHKVDIQFIRSLHLLLYKDLMKPKNDEEFDFAGHMKSDDPRTNYLEKLKYLLECVDLMLKTTDKTEQIIDPIALATFGHIALVVSTFRIFCDGNGRVSRLLMDYILLRLGYPPIHIPYEESDKYFEYILRADKTFREFMRCMYQYLMGTMEKICEVATKGKSAAFTGDEKQPSEQGSPTVYAADTAHHHLYGQQQQQQQPQRPLGSSDGSSNALELGRMGSSAGTGSISINKFVDGHGPYSLSPLRDTTISIQSHSFSLAAFDGHSFSASSSSTNSSHPNPNIDPKTTASFFGPDNRSEWRQLKRNTGMALLFRQAIRLFNPTLFVHDNLPPISSSSHNSTDSVQKLQEAVTTAKKPVVEGSPLAMAFREALLDFNPNQAVSVFLTENGDYTEERNH